MSLFFNSTRSRIWLIWTAVGRITQWVEPANPPSGCGEVSWCQVLPYWLHPGHELLRRNRLPPNEAVIVQKDSSGLFSWNTPRRDLDRTHFQLPYFL